MDEATRDPRTEPGHQPELFPRCDGRVLPAGRLEASDAKVLALAAAYYRLNVAYAKLRDYRRKIGKSREREFERTLLREVEMALLKKEAEEDELSKSGLCATPTLRSGQVVDLQFCAPGHRGAAARVVMLSSSLRVDFDVSFPWDHDQDPEGGA